MTSSSSKQWEREREKERERTRKNYRIRTWTSNVVWQSLAICQSGICHKASEMFGVLGRAVWASARHLGRLSGWHERGGRCDSEMRTTCRQHLLQQTVHSFIWILVYLTVLQSILISFYLSLCDTMWLSIHQECMRLQDYSIFFYKGNRSHRVLCWALCSHVQLCVAVCDYMRAALVWKDLERAVGKSGKRWLT